MSQLRREMLDGLGKIAKDLERLIDAPTSLTLDQIEKLRDIKARVDEIAMRITLDAFSNGGV